jgi:hypothetical protein
MRHKDVRHRRITGDVKGKTLRIGSNQFDARCSWNDCLTEFEAKERWRPGHVAAGWRVGAAQSRVRQRHSCYGNNQEWYEERESPSGRASHPLATIHFRDAT